ADRDAVRVGPAGLALAEADAAGATASARGADLSELLGHEDGLTGQRAGVTGGVDALPALPAVVVRRAAVPADVSPESRQALRVVGALGAELGVGRAEEDAGAARVVGVVDAGAVRRAVGVRGARRAERRIRIDAQAGADPTDDARVALAALGVALAARDA